MVIGRKSRVGVVPGIALVAALCPPAAKAQDAFSVPSGIEISYLDQFVETQASGQTWLTLRFVSPEIGPDEGEKGYDEIAGDLDLLCDTQGLRAAREQGSVDQVMIALLDRVIERGSVNPEATMYVGAYLPTDGGCVWQ